MRPIKLTMVAFGPYAATEIVDFRDAVASGLFGIYGPTGSGKSTIFSAMTFALFGEAARSDQDTASLRSDHAADDLLTKVEFIFEVGKKRYLIRRTPDQMRPALRGDGETKDKHTAWLFDVTGIDIDDISEKITGEAIAEKKVSAVKDAVCERLGYGAEQFRQIVLLPQGKFEKFLTAKTDERMKILRDLFDVTLYRNLAQNLKEQAKQAEEQVKIDRNTCVRRLEQEGFESPDALNEGIDDTKKSEVESKNQANAATKAAQIAAVALTTAKQTEEKFLAAEQAQIILESLEDKSVEMKVAEETLVKAKKVKSLIDIYNAMQAARAAVVNAETALTEAKAVRKTAKSQKEAAEVQLKKQEALSETRDDQRATIDELERSTKKFEQAEELKIKWRDVRFEENKTKKDLEDAETALKTIQTKHTAMQAEGKTAQEQNLKRNELKTQLMLAQQKLEATKRYTEAKQSFDSAIIDSTNAQQSHSNNEQMLKQAKVNFEAAETALAATQAQHLAEKLKDDHPCAVCGSTTHPAPATGSAESAGLDTAFREAREKLKNAQTTHTNSLANLAGINATVKDRKVILSKLSTLQQTLIEAQTTVDHLKHQLQNLGEERSIKEIDTEVTTLSMQITELETKVRKEDDVYRATCTETALAKQAYDTALAAIPKTLRETGALANALKNAQAKHQAMLNAFKIAHDQARATRDGCLASTKDLESAQKALNLEIKQNQESEVNYRTRLQEQGLTQEQFDRHRENIDQIETLSANLKGYEQDIAIAKDRLKSLRKAIKDKSRPELDKLEELSAEAECVRDEAASQAATLLAKTVQLENLRNSISGELARIEKVERDTAALRELAALFNAANVAKLDLETFAIGAMFDQVLNSANLRLQPMTNGRYNLEREMDGKGGGRRGLGISVHDIHTGKARATATLSGGETFIAALALALGLSDIVESTSGQIQLDTIFIDEGFGSLDTENDTGTLDQVLQTLQDLVSNNRAVGLISHVPLVQQAIPNGFAIKKTPTGSHIEARDC